MGSLVRWSQQLGGLTSSLKIKLKVGLPGPRHSSRRNQSLSVSDPLCCALCAWVYVLPFLKSEHPGLPWRPSG